MKIKQKGQVAMEFIMTYGWALLVILVAIGALSYFGVLDPTKILPERCNFQQELPCSDFQILTNDMNFTLQNTAAQTLNIVDVEWKEAGSGTWQACVGGFTLEPPGKFLVEDKKTINCKHDLSYDSGRRVKLKVKMSWNYGNLAFTHTGFGEIYANVQ